MPWVEDPTIERLIQHVLRACDAGAVVRRHWPAGLRPPIYVVAFGKASAAMTKAAIEVQAGVSGVVIADPRFASDDIPGFEVHAADHPFATDRNVRAAERVERLVKSLDASATLVALISGGGSAHLTSPQPGFTLADLRHMTEGLLRAGASIEELNCIRKHCERLKGGRLGAMCNAGRVELIVVCDVRGDRRDVIASGPFEPDPTTYGEALAVLARHDLRRTGDPVTDFLEAGARGEHPETPKPGEGSWWKKVRVRIGANNGTAIQAAESWAVEHGYETTRLSAAMTGEAVVAGRDVGRRVMDLVRLTASDGQRRCLIAGGETTVTVGRSKGTGGRNQELALAAAQEIDGATGVRLMALGTDGVDGPTDAAGAVVDGRTCERARGIGLEPAKFLAEHNSHEFFAQAGGHIKTGPTGTNVNDVVVALIDSGAG